MAISAERKTVTSTATLLATGPVAIALRNITGGVIYLGAPTVTINDGFPWESGTVALDLADGETIHGIAGTTQTVAVLRQI
jgi:hypothetical protein